MLSRGIVDVEPSRRDDNPEEQKKPLKPSSSTRALSRNSIVGSDAVAVARMVERLTADLRIKEEAANLLQTETVELRRAADQQFHEWQTDKQRANDKVAAAERSAAEWQAKAERLEHELKRTVEVGGSQQTTEHDQQVEQLRSQLEHALFQIDIQEASLSDCSVCLQCVLSMPHRVLSGTN